MVAGTVDAVAGGEKAFVESAPPGEAWATYSDLLGPEDCAVIDREAYRRARSWFRPDGADHDPTEIEGASLGRACELRSTAMLVAYLRARSVLTRLLDAGPVSTVQIRNAGEEWAVAARSLGLDVDERSRIGRSLASIVPDPACREPRRLERVLGRLRGPLDTEAGEVILSESPGWATTYHAALLRRWPAIAVNPGRRLLLSRPVRRHLRTVWLADSPADDLARDSLELAEPEDAGDVMLRSSFLADLPRLAGWAALGRSFPARVAVAAQDVTPAIRSLLLGFQAAGGRVVTVEHGIAGGYAEQVHSIADRLGAWGPIQAAYHRVAGPPSIDVVELGWPRLAAAVAERVPERVQPLDLVFFGQPTIPLSAGSWPEDGLHAQRIVEGYAGQNPNRRVVVKPHPATRAYGGGGGSHARTTLVSGDSLAIIRQARIVAAPASTTALEAMALGRPVIRLVYRGSIGPTDFLRESGAAVNVASVDEFEAAAEELLTNSVAYRTAVDRGRAYAAAFVTGLHRPGSAEDRLVELVRQLLAVQDGSISDISAATAGGEVRDP